MAQASVRSDERGSASSGPSIRQQLEFVLSLYQTLTNVYFLLIEQRASASTNSTRAGIAAQLKRFSDVVRGVEDGRHGPSSSSAVKARRAQAGTASGVDAAAGLLSLRGEHAARIRALPIVQSTLIRHTTGVSTAQRQTDVQPSIKQVIHAIQGLDDILAELMERARRHAVNQARVRVMVQRIEERDAATTAGIRQLARLGERCGALVATAEKERMAIEQARQRPLDYEEVLRYARTLSQTTTAPPGFVFDGASAGAAKDSGQWPEEGGGDGQNPTAAAAVTGQSRLDQVPAHLQDKLPFPSMDAIRRGASEVRTPTWAMFKRGELHPTGGPDTGSGGEATAAAEVADVDMAEGEREQNRQRQKRAQRAAAAEQGHRAGPATAMAMDEEEEGFGLDLS